MPSKMKNRTTETSSNLETRPTATSDRTVKPRGPISNPKRKGLPLTKYYSIVPLHLMFTLFAIHFLPSKHSNKSKWNHQHLIEQTHQSLIMINLALIFIQIWFSTSLRNFKRNQIHQVNKVKHQDLSQILKKVMIDLKLKKLDPIIKKSLIEFLIPIQDALIMTFLSSILIHFLIILMGAPIFINGLKTYLLACLVSILAILPSALVIGWNQGREKVTWIRMYSEFKPKNDLEVILLCPALGTCIGSWLGGIPIPLDWDRPWQKWPVTCVLGASIGHVIGTIVAMILVGLRKHTN
ncbi:hypothetical protein CROQUDRAFT_649726 [Cronartium quercuum f. sp. fusiforme G11]|uniref:Glycosylphosphatidylinositol anchor biosynthesis protein 11 n=1 Tax=Cronartium quercuum f. sp. fusiforme G11 TaxID=708437 RepID=A0A9P6NS03_9BASI|nr:hypothetical protein CROQUDRAFT_649726 [Cronartium quercuum f. sp. fusiforme G11]